jgi:hypothetical protein
VDETTKAWIVGISFSLIVGGLGTYAFLTALRYSMGEKPKGLFKRTDKEVPGWVTGSVERLFFTVLVGRESLGAPALMLVWLGLKMATNWNHPTYKDKPEARAYAFSALLAGLVSMLFALVGGLIINWLSPDR